MKINRILKEYRLNKALIDITEARIEQYKWAINHPEEWYRDYIPESKELGMPSAPRGSGAKDVVSGFLIEKELNEEILKEWIKKEESKIFFKRLEVKQIELCLSILGTKELFIIENKYINDKMAWIDIETSYSLTFKESLTLDALKKKHKNAVDKIKEILTPFYTEHGYSIE